MSQYSGLWKELRQERERRIQEWKASLEKEAMVLGGGYDMDVPEPEYEEGPRFEYDDSEELRWEHEYKPKAERSASHVWVPTNWSDCYESEIMGRPNGYVLRGDC